MKSLLYKNHIALIFNILFIMILFTDCKKTENPIIFPQGTFPDTIINLKDINSAFDDYNLALYRIYGNTPIIFSSNRASSGGQFDLEQAIVTFYFDQTNEEFGIGTEVSNDAFLAKLINKAKTPGNDFGPYRFFSSADGYEYMVLSSVNAEGNLDLFYFKNLPVSGTGLPDIDGPFPLRLFNTNSDDAYFCLDSNQDTAYFSSDRNGNFDIFMHKRPGATDLEIFKWFDADYAESTKIDSICGPYDDKCPMVFRKFMVFASNRPGGLGGFDLYSSVFRNGKWSSPVNLGPGINTSSDEYRPVIGYHPDFKNNFLMFSSDRPGGKGGFDLYFSGVDFLGNQLIP